MGKPKRRGNDGPMKSACGEYECPCHDKLIEVANALERINDEADHALHTEVKNPDEIRTTNLAIIQSIAVKARNLAKGIK